MECDESTVFGMLNGGQNIQEYQWDKLKVAFKDYIDFAEIEEVFAVNADAEMEDEQIMEEESKPYSRIDKIEIKVDQLDKRMQKVEDRLEEIIKLLKQGK